MNRIQLSLVILIASCLASCLASAGCGAKAAPDAKSEAPPPAQVVRDADSNLVTVDHASQFPIATASGLDVAPSLDVTGVVSPDVSRQVPAISLASGRAVEIFARIGDSVRKGQLLMKVQSADISTAFSDYEQAVSNEKLTRVQLDRARELKDKGAIAQKDLEIAQNAEDNAQVTRKTTAEHLRVLGADVDHPSSLIDVRAPISGVITEQNITAAGPVKTLDNSPNLFTITDLSQLWIICDVYENDLSFVHLGEFADVHLNAYPDLVLKGRISDIGPVLDPAIRTAKVRLQISNPGTLRLGLFVTATFHGTRKQLHAVVPASAILHLHDREWAYVPDGDARFRRVEVTSGRTLPQNMQEVSQGLSPGDKVVANALVLQSTVEQ